MEPLLVNLSRKFDVWVKFNWAQNLFKVKIDPFDNEKSYISASSLTKNRPSPRFPAPPPHLHPSEPINSMTGWWVNFKFLVPNFRSFELLFGFQGMMAVFGLGASHRMVSYWIFQRKKRKHCPKFGTISNLRLRLAWTWKVFNFIFLL